MGRRKIGVGLVHRMPDPVVLEGVRHRQVVIAHPMGRIALIDVIPHVQDQVGRIADQMPVRREIAVLVVLAADQGESHLFERCATRGRGARTTDRTANTACRESIPVVGARLEALRLDVYAVGPLRCCVLDTVPDDGGHPLVTSDFPLDGHHFPGHTSVRRARLWSEPCP